MAKAGKLIEELGDVELDPTDVSVNLHLLKRRFQVITRDLAWTLDYQADILEATLGTMPTNTGHLGRVSSWVRAKTVAWYLRAAADAVQFAGKMGVKCWGVYVKYFSIK